MFIYLFNLRLFTEFLVASRHTEFRQSRSHHIKVGQARTTATAAVIRNLSIGWSFKLRLFYSR
jgi:hypothetical protein